MFVEQLALLPFGHAAAEPLGDMDGPDKKLGMCPVEDIRVQRVITVALCVGALDADVVVAYLSAGDRGTVAVETTPPMGYNDRTNRGQRSRKNVECSSTAAPSWVLPAVAG